MVKTRKPRVKKAVEPPICPYCLRPSLLAEHRWGKQWECRPCDASVGCHQNSERPKGTLADKTLRQARKDAHAAFDPLWQKKLRLNPGMSKSDARQRAYRWLAKQLNLDIGGAHVAMFDLDTCRRAIEICTSYASFKTETA